MKNNSLHENIKKLNDIDDEQSLVESSLSRLIQRNKSCDIIFITAYKSPRWIKDNYQIENGNGVDRIIKNINRERNNALLMNIRAMGFNSFKVDGSYENQERKDKGLPNYTDKEESFAVINTYHNDDFIDKLLKLAIKYDQKSILYVPIGGNNCKFYYANGKVVDAGNSVYGKDSAFKSLINGRPFVVESISDLITPNIKTQSQYNQFMNANGKDLNDEDII